MSEFEKRDLAVEINSEVLGCNIWLCSDNEMAEQVRRDDPGAVTYTTREIRQLIKLNPLPESLKKINEAKEAFPKSKVVSTEPKRGGS